MRILIVTPHFHPENFRVNDLAADFINRGHSVSVLTSIPNYPKGFFYEGYGIFTKSRETYNGIKIYRAPIIPRGSGSNFRLSLNYISYVLGGIFTSIFFIKKKIDVIFIFESSPITVALPAIFVKKIKKIPICIWVLDLWPESVVSGGNIKSNFIPSLLNPLVKFIYDKSDKILVSSNGFVDSVKDKGVNIEKIEYFPQWAEDLFKPVDANFELLPNPVPKESFKIMFAGNIGEAQDFPSIIEAARILKDENIQWLILGDGRKSKWVKEKIKDYKLEKCFHMLGSHPLESMPSYYALSDALLFSLKNEYIFSITIPAKVQSYLACGKPILGMINGEARKLINSNKVGLSCKAGDYKSLSENILKISKLNNKDLNILSKNALSFHKKNFDRKNLLDKLEKILKSLIKT